MHTQINVVQSSYYLMYEVQEVMRVVGWTELTDNDGTLECDNELMKNAGVHTQFARTWLQASPFGWSNG